MVTCAFRARVDEVLDLVGLRSAARRRAGGFSLGMSLELTRDAADYRAASAGPVAART